MAAKKSEQKHVVVRELTRTLACQLTDKELQQAGKDQATALVAISQLESRLKSFKKQIESEIAGHQACVEKKTDMIQSGEEFRDVKCLEARNFETGMLTVTRKDNNEIVESRPLRDNERQEVLPLGDGN